MAQFGTTTEFETETTGGGPKADMLRLPAGVSADVRNAHLAINIRVVDTASGSVVAAPRIAGSALSGEAAASMALGGGEKEK